MPSFGGGFFVKNGDLELDGDAVTEIDDRSVLADFPEVVFELKLAATLMGRLVL